MVMREFLNEVQILRYLLEYVVKELVAAQESGCYRCDTARNILNKLKGVASECDVSLDKKPPQN